MAEDTMADSPALHFCCQLLKSILRQCCSKISKETSELHDVNPPSYGSVNENGNNRPTTSAPIGIIPGRRRCRSEPDYVHRSRVKTDSNNSELGLFAANQNTNANSTQFPISVQLQPIPSEIAPTLGSDNNSTGQTANAHSSLMWRSSGSWEEILNTRGTGKTELHENHPESRKNLFPGNEVYKKRSEKFVPGIHEEQASQGARSVAKTGKRAFEQMMARWRRGMAIAKEASTPESYSGEAEKPLSGIWPFSDTDSGVEPGNVACADFRCHSPVHSDPKPKRSGVERQSSDIDGRSTGVSGSQDAGMTEAVLRVKKGCNTKTETVCEQEHILAISDKSS